MVLKIDYAGISDDDNDSRDDDEEGDNILDLIMYAMHKKISLEFNCVAK